MKTSKLLITLVVLSFGISGVNTFAGHDPADAKPCSMLDTNKDGKISAAELKAADKNGDGKLSADEHTSAGFNKNVDIKKHDQNNDGHHDVAEMNKMCS